MSNRDPYSDFYFYLGRLHELAESLALVLSLDICPVEVER